MVVFCDRLRLNIIYEHNLSLIDDYPAQSNFKFIRLYLQYHFNFVVQFCLEHRKDLNYFPSFSQYNGRTTMNQITSPLFFFIYLLGPYYQHLKSNIIDILVHTRQNPALRVNQCMRKQRLITQHVRKTCSKLVIKTWANEHALKSTLLRWLVTVTIQYSTKNWSKS